MFRFWIKLISIVFSRQLVIWLLNRHNIINDIDKNTYFKLITFVNYRNQQPMKSLPIYFEIQLITKEKKLKTNSIITAHLHQTSLNISFEISFHHC
jgi:hypothetical protein